MAAYIELHTHSNFSFLEGASHIEELVLAARELGYEALARRRSADQGRPGPATRFSPHSRPGLLRG
ncbi:MAG: PHP domain-containing protein, partial [Dehalococcoidia bacterium]